MTRTNTADRTISSGQKKHACYGLYPDHLRHTNTSFYKLHCSLVAQRFHALARVSWKKGHAKKAISPQRKKAKRPPRNQPGKGPCHPAMPFKQIF
ncbi:MAG: hypothetical protein JRJ42_10775 [Deltaproteobacteria bacterium]|nr:hypothetical protein [Deltaproteobacteria bacterium]MBW2020933.1 hypothetical protein [Deltaproteobacteria bacterium]RLB79584.1 MAG: hypothetical protein DRH17_13535 [Deltaproteobacteria bacterium]